MPVFSRCDGIAALGGMHDRRSGADDLTGPLICQHRNYSKHYAKWSKGRQDS
jgi:hypothetical protein